MLLLCPWLALAAPDDPPGRVGRLSDAQGRVSWYDADEGQWAAAQRNLPLTQGDRVSTDGDARAELRIGSTTLRLGGGSELEFERLDDDRVRLRLLSGSLAVRVRSRERADELDVITAEADLQPLRAGHYRIDRVDDTTYAGSWRGELRVADLNDPFTVDGGRRVELYREGRLLRHAWISSPDDEFADWVAREDRRDERSAAYRYVSPEMTGAEDLDDHGRWEQHPEYGAVWVPVGVAAGWAPYRYGRWVWMRPWGWTWVDEAPWGFAPFHYGRWVHWRDRWCWTPGPYVPRPVYAPALVAWVGGGQFSASVSIGGPAVGWLPLAPHDPYVPWYRYSPGYRDRLNPRPPPGRPYPAPVPTGPIMYGNQGVPGAVTVVPRDALQRREPVARHVIDLRTPLQGPLPVQAVAPEPIVRPVQPGARPVPPPPMRVQPVRPVMDLRRPEQERQERGERPERVDLPQRPAVPVQPVQPVHPVQVQPVQPARPVSPPVQVQPVQPVHPVQPVERPERPERVERPPMPQPVAPQPPVQVRPQPQPAPVQVAPVQVAPPQRPQPQPQPAQRPAREEGRDNPGRGNTRERNDVR